MEGGGVKFSSREEHHVQRVLPTGWEIFTRYKEYSDRVGDLD